MEELEIEWHTDGFVKDAKYSSHISNVIDPFKDKFPTADKLVINIHELTLYELRDGNRKKSVVISDDRKTITINHNVQKYYTYEGKPTSTPEPIDVFNGLRSLLTNAIKEFNHQ